MTTSPKDEVVKMSEDEYWTDVKDPYFLQIAETDPLDVYPKHNPGPDGPDGRFNFECHCVGHLVASPCGYAFRDVITCQKAVEPGQKGMCDKQLITFMECVNRTQCFQTPESEQSSAKK